MDAIEQGYVGPSQVYYVNVDDTGTGLAEKVELAEEYGFHMISEGYRGFSVSQFLPILFEMTASDQASGIIIIMDTMKKFADLMDKQKSSQFSQMGRKFVLKGGTLIGLAHTNKNLGKNGKRVYAGTTDIIDDFDCAYILDEVSINEDAKTKVVAFENEKRRGNVARQAAYSYSIEDGISYTDLLMSVEPIDNTQLVAVKQAETLRSDAEIIDAITACIRAGVNTKMKLAKAAAQDTGVSRRVALEKLEQYTGNNPSQYRWFVTVGDRGANIYHLLEPPVTTEV